MTCCIALFIEGRQASAGDLSVLRQHRKVFRRRDILAFMPEGHPMAPIVREVIPEIRHVLLPAAASLDGSVCDAFKLSEDFYDSVKAYDYVLVSSLDTWPLYDALDWWMERGCDYLAAPWIGLRGCGSEWIRGLDHPRGGRGAASLRRVDACREFVRRLDTCGFDLGQRFLWDDIVLSGGLPSNNRQRLPRLKYFAWADQARFAWDRPHYMAEKVHGSTMDTLMDVSRGHLPMLLYRPSAGVAKRYCLPDEDFEHIFLFSSASKPEYRYKPAVDAVAPAGPKRLLVFFNDCPALLGNADGFALAEEQGRIMTLHNDTVVEPYGPSNFGELPYKLAAARYTGRHDSRTFSWRPMVSPQPPVVTYDGEVRDDSFTAVLRSIGSEVPDHASPTSGYMAYRIFRALHPWAKIHLVNFFGNTRGFSVCVRHDVTWEQAAYRRDPLVDFMVVE